MAETPKVKQEKKFDLLDEGVATLVRLTILGWSAAILTINYLQVPGLAKTIIDPTFIASVFTGTLATFGVATTKKNGDEKKPGAGAKTTYTVEYVAKKEKE